MSVVIAIIVIGLLIAFAAYLWRERARVEAELNVSRKLLAATERAGSIGNWEIDVATGKIVWSDEMFRVLHLDAGSGAPTLDEWMRQFHPNDRDACKERFAQAMDSGSAFTHEARVLNSKGMSVWARIAAEFQPAAEGRAAKLAGTVIDISRHKAAEEQIQDYRIVFDLRHLEQYVTTSEASALIDDLTGISNRHMLVDVLDKEIKRATRHETTLSLILVSLETFEQLDEEYGHQASLHLLRQLAGALQLQARETDVVARYGGQGFAIILPVTDNAGAMIAADRIRKSISASNWPLRSATASFGIVEHSADTTAVDLIALAHDALLNSRRNGKSLAAVSVESGKAK